MFEDNVDFLLRAFWLCNNRLTTLPRSRLGSRQLIPTSCQTGHGDGDHWMLDRSKTIPYKGKDHSNVCVYGGIYSYMQYFSDLPISSRLVYLLFMPIKAIDSNLTFLSIPVDTFFTFNLSRTTRQTSDSFRWLALRLSRLHGDTSWCCVSHLCVQRSRTAP